MQRREDGSAFNRLIHESSPYLRQHARNPVDWFPWGPEAFARARDQDKPIFLSVGYSTCHWCHVMAHESFEDEDVARLLNEHFVPVKVDRERRPDVDAIYMNATQLFAGNGGWPNSVWLTPDGRPWYAGTYFPREDRFGRAGFKTLLSRLAEAWRTRRKDIHAQADAMADALRRLDAMAGGMAARGGLDRSLVENAVARLRAAYDPVYGGFGTAPKFPPHNSLALLLHECRAGRGGGALEMVAGTLDAIAAGGIRDHVGGGFHRYATDGRWLVPHFEKMLYDNALLARAFAEAWSLAGKAAYRRAAAEAYDWVLGEMADAGGGLHSALDADSEGEEGRFYLWTRRQILDALGEQEGELVCRVYNVQPDGNYHDEATGRQASANILHLGRPLEELAADFEGPADALIRRLAAARQKLLAARGQRVPPARDEKVLTAWNALMIGSLARGGRLLEEPRYVRAACRAAGFVLGTLRRDGRLMRSFWDGKAELAGCLDDHAFLADALLDLHEATGEGRWLAEARGVADAMLQHFWDADGKGFFITADDADPLLLRAKMPTDREIPAGNGVAARVLLRLGVLQKDRELLARAKEVLEAFLGFMQRSPQGAESLILAASLYLDTPAVHAAAAAAEGPTPDATAERPPVALAAFASRRTVEPGGGLQVAVRMSVAPGWHVNAAGPAREEVVATQVTAAGPAFSLGEGSWPPARRATLGFRGEPLAVYEGTVWIRVPVAVAADAEPGAASLVLAVRTQACSDRQCRAPETLELAIPLRIGPAGEAEPPRHPDVFGSPPA